MMDTPETTILNFVIILITFKALALRKGFLIGYIYQQLKPAMLKYQKARLF